MLGQLASHRDPDYKPAIVAAGGIRTLVGLLCSSSAEVYGPAVMALRHLSKCTTEFAAIGAAGAIPPLMRLLDSGDMEVQQHAAVALANLALEPGNRPLIVREGGIHAFLRLAGNAEEWGQVRLPACEKEQVAASPCVCIRLQLELRWHVGATVAQ